jgi:hypothetical protein
MVYLGGKVQLIGVLIIFNALAFALWWATSNGQHMKAVGGMATLACIVGIILTLQRGYEFKSPFGTLKAEAEQDVHDIGVMKAAIAGHQTEIERQAKEAKQLGATLQSQKKEVDSLVSDLGKKIDEAKKSTDALASIVDFAELVQRAQNDDRSAFDILRKMDKPAAKSAVDTIIRQRYSLLNVNQKVPWVEGIKPEDLPIETIRAAYVEGNSSVRVGVIQFLWRQSKVSKYEKVAFLMDIIMHDKSLTSAEQAGRELRELTGITSPLSTEAFVEWWSKNEAGLKAEATKKDPAP